MGGGEGRSIEMLRQGRQWTDTHRATREIQRPERKLLRGQTYERERGEFIH